MKRALVPLAALVACARAAAPPPSPVERVTAAPASSPQPSDPVLVLGRAPSPIAADRIPVKDGGPAADWKPPKDRCPDGIRELVAVHVPLGDAMELAPGASPVVALGQDPEAVDVLFDRARGVVRVAAKKYGLVYVLVEREKLCTFYGVSAGY